MICCSRPLLSPRVFGVYAHAVEQAEEPFLRRRVRLLDAARLRAIDSAGKSENFLPRRQSSDQPVTSQYIEIAERISNCELLYLPRRFNAGLRRDRPVRRRWFVLESVL